MVEKLIDPWGVWGSGPIRLEVPHSGVCLGMTAFFEYLFGFRDGHFSGDYQRVQRNDDVDTVLFELEELAEAAFGFYSPDDFADALEKKIDPKANQGRALVSRIRDFEKTRRTVYVSRELLQNHGSAYYVAPCSNMDEASVRSVLEEVGRGFHSSTKFRKRIIGIPRLGYEEDEWPVRGELEGTMPINFYRRTADELRERLNALDSPVTMYFCDDNFFTYFGLGGELDFDPFTLVRLFRSVDTSGYQIVKKD